MRKVVMGIILVFLVVAGFAGLVNGENFGYWPSSTGNAPSGHILIMICGGICGLNRSQGFLQKT